MPIGRKHEALSVTIEARATDRFITRQAAMGYLWRVSSLYTAHKLSAALAYLTSRTCSVQQSQV